MMDPRPGATESRLDPLEGDSTDLSLLETNKEPGISPLFATDGSAEAKAGIELMCGMMFPAGTEAVVLKVQEQGHSAHDVASGLALEECGRLCNSGWWVRQRVRRASNVAEEILRVAAESNANLIVVGNRGEGKIAPPSMGSVADRIVRSAPVSVLVSGPQSGRPGSGEDRTHQEAGTKRTPLRVLIAYDGSEPARSALNQVASLPLPDESQIRILTVLDPTEATDTASASRRTRPAGHDADLRDAANRVGATSLVVGTELVESRDPATEILRVADRIDADLIVVGDTGRSKGGLGRVADRVVRLSRRAVLIVRSPRSD